MWRKNSQRQLQPVLVCQPSPEADLILSPLLDMPPQFRGKYKSIWHIRKPAIHLPTSGKQVLPHSGLSRRLWALKLKFNCSDQAFHPDSLLAHSAGIHVFTGTTSSLFFIEFLCLWMDHTFSCVPLVHFTNLYYPLGSWRHLNLLPFIKMEIFLKSVMSFSVSLNRMRGI